jgi:hypothetical protein
MVGQMYVEKLVPIHPTQKYPLFFITGAAQTATVLRPLSGMHHLLIVNRRIGSTHPTAGKAGHPISLNRVTPFISPINRNAADLPGSPATAHYQTTTSPSSKTTSPPSRSPNSGRKPLSTLKFVLPLPFLLLC